MEWVGLSHVEGGVVRLVVGLSEVSGVVVVWVGLSYEVGVVVSLENFSCWIGVVKTEWVRLIVRYVWEPILEQ